MIEINLLGNLSKRLSIKYLWLLIGMALLIISLISVLSWLYIQKIQAGLIEEKQQKLGLEQEIKRLNSIKPKLEPGPVLQPEKPIIQRLRHQERALAQQIISIHYAKALDLQAMFKDKSNDLLSKHGRVVVDQRSNQLWFEDSPKRLMLITKMIKQLDLASEQIIIEARIVTMNQESARDLGVRLGLIAGNQGRGTAETSSPSPGGRLSLDLAATPLEATAASLGFTHAFAITQRLLDTELSALESAGRAKVIASPRLVTSNHLPALIESGEDIPYQEFSANGTTSVAFKKAVLRLKVLPQVTRADELMMSLVINQDSDSGKRVQGVPIISTKAIETNILVRNKETIILGGIYQEDQNGQTQQVPFLGDLPTLGALFQRKQLRIRHESLLIFITPEILRQS